MWKYVLAWVPMVFIPIANGALREGWYGKYLSELQAHQISTVTGIQLFGLFIWALIRLWRPVSSGQAVTIGLVWLGMTIVFEFLFGHYVAKRSWYELRRDYNLFAGHVWLVILIWVTNSALRLFPITAVVGGRGCFYFRLGIHSNREKQ